MFWGEHSYVEYSTTYIGFSSLSRKSAFLLRIKISCKVLSALFSFHGEADVRPYQYRNELIVICIFLCSYALDHC